MVGPSASCGNLTAAAIPAGCPRFVVPPISEGRGVPVVNVVGGVVVLTVSAVVPLVLAKAALSLVLSLMAVPRSADPIPATMQPDSAAAPATRAGSSSV
jgi:hypothetical protein